MLFQTTHAAHVLLVGHGMNHRTGPEKQQGLEKGVSYQVKDACRECCHAAGQKHIPELTDSGIGKHSLDVILCQSDGSCKESGHGADRRNDRQRIRGHDIEHVGASYHVDSGRYHGGGMDQSGYRGRTLHGIRQPDI